MTLEERIKAFAKLGKYLHAIDEAEFLNLIETVRNQNPWFTEENIRLAVTGLTKYLDEDRLTRWVSSYSIVQNPSKTVALIMAGNIPFVGFHDLLSTLISGHRAMVKLSSKDTTLIPFLTKKLIAIEPVFSSSIEYVDLLKNFDAVIATGSDNSARYFEYYFGKYPHIIRKNRTSCAILTGKETQDELIALGQDIFSYFGLGCRNVSKLYIPTDFDLTSLFENWNSFSPIIHHHKYHNNYDYQKSILLVNQTPFLDNGFVMLTESNKLVSPISVIYFERYTNLTSLKQELALINNKVQCLVGKVTPATVSFGQAQYPELWDYADQIDTLKFLTELR